MHEITSTDEKWAQAGVPAGGRAQFCVWVCEGGSYLELDEQRGVFHPVTALRPDWKVKHKSDFTLLCGLLEHERY